MRALTLSVKGQIMAVPRPSGLAGGRLTSGSCGTTRSPPRMTADVSRRCCSPPCTANGMPQDGAGRSATCASGHRTHCQDFGSPLTMVCCRPPPRPRRSATGGSRIDPSLAKAFAVRSTPSSDRCSNWDPCLHLEQARCQLSFLQNQGLGVMGWRNSGTFDSAELSNSTVRAEQVPPGGP
jgi:hypothetical protein